MQPAIQQLLIFLLAAAALHGLYLAALLSARSGSASPARLLGMAVAAVSLYLLNYLLFLSGLIRHFPGALGLLYPWVFLAGGGVYFFVRQSLSPGFRWKWAHALHLLPFVWAWYRIYPLLMLPAGKKQALIEWFLNPEEAFDWRLVLQGNVHIYVLAACAAAAWWHAARLERRFERIEDRRKARWMRRFCAFFLALLAADLGVKFSFVFLHIPSAAMEYALAAALALAIHALGYRALGRFDRLPRILPEAALEKYKTSPLTPGQMESGCQALLRLMADRKPWLDPELRIAGLAAQLGMPSHHLSQILNEAVGTGFYDFVNGYRVREAQRLLLDARFRHFAIEAVGMESGFSNKTTFNRVFKKVSGMTPSAYAEAGGQAAGSV